MRLEVGDTSRGIGLRGQIPGDQLDRGAIHAAVGIHEIASDLYAGVQIARDLVNADGGVNGAPIELVTRDLTSESDATARVADLKAHGVSAILGAYSSSLSMPVSEATQAAGLLYWEAGAVADQLTGRGYPLVFRVGASGTNLGTMAGHFAAGVIA